MSNSNKDVLVKRLEVPRPSATSQGFITIKEYNMINKEDEFFFRFVQDRGDTYKSGKRAAKALAGGGVDVVFDAIIGDATYRNFIERDLLDAPFGFRLISLNGELIEKKKNLSTLLRRYDFGSRLPLEIKQDGAEDNITVVTIIPVRDEIPDEAALRECFSETGETYKIVPPENGMAYYPRNPKNPKESAWLPSQFGEIMVEITNDYLKDDYPGKKLNHYLYTFNLEESNEDKNGGNGNGEKRAGKIREVDEIAGVHKIRLDLLMKDIYQKDLCVDYNNREGNPEGFYPSHAIRTMRCLKILKIPYARHLPKTFNPDLWQDRFGLLGSFLPEKIDEAICAGKFEFSEEEMKTMIGGRSILPEVPAIVVTTEFSKDIVLVPLTKQEEDSDNPYDDESVMAEFDRLKKAKDAEAAESYRKWMEG